MPPLQINLADGPYHALIGVGGIGAGRFFALKGNHTLGREESRAGHFLPSRDYCKLHIISHYVKTLLGPSFPTVLIGQVGEDEIGRQLLDEMKATGLDTRYVRGCPDAQTLYSICFSYPDGSGGNLTTDDSACMHMQAADVIEAEPDFIRFAGRGVALAAPEVPLPAREKLLQLGTAHRFLRVASFVSAEMPDVLQSNLLHLVDLLAINVDEAAAALEMDRDQSDPEDIVPMAVERLSALYPNLRLSITAGRRGSWSWDGTALMHVPACLTEAVSTAGAGDAHLAGLIVGLCAGLNLTQAQELGTMVAALSVTSPHTINPEIDRESLHAFALKQPAQLSPEVLRLFDMTQVIC